MTPSLSRISNSLKESVIRGAGQLSLEASLVVVLGCALAIVSTYGRMSQTWDEPNHIATGVEWLQDGTYLMWTENPPLARVAVALGPYYVGARLPDTGRTKSDIETTRGGVAWGLGNYLLYGTGSYRRRLALARAGTLPFFLLAAAVLWFWLGRDYALSGFVSIAAFCTLPAILAHTALATTDIAFAAMFLLFIWQLVRWLEDSTAARSASLGACLGLTVATKFTALVFIPSASLAVIAARMWSEWRDARLFWKMWRSRILKTILIVGPIGALVLWGAYRFSVGTISELPYRLDNWVVFGPYATGIRGALANAAADIPLPAPEFFHGVLALWAHNEAGHPAYALGKVNQSGFWYFYPLALLVKTPFPFMIFMSVGLVAAARRIKEMPWWVGGVFGAILMILLSLTASAVNIGIRHVLAVYGLAAVGAAAALARVFASLDTLRRGVTALFFGVLLAWQVTATASSYPSFLTYFNPIVGDEPGAYLVDSDLDWGQGIFKLEEFFSQHEAEILYVAINGSAWLCEYNLPELRALQPYTPVKGWIAVSELPYRYDYPLYRRDPPCDPSSMNSWERTGTGWLRWLRDYEPVAILGRTIRVYHVE
jgi:hypothetical protein